ncbi:MAG TPA: DUF2630 family protein [Conexibacter sp.]|nr:DUF2630 family protein [Conexibacter sp.]
MNDEQIQQQIEALEAEQRKLREHEATDRDDDALLADRSRLEAIRVELDRLWDLQRQRRALREAGGDPDDAAERSGDTVERYLQ